MHQANYLKEIAAHCARHINLHPLHGKNLVRAYTSVSYFTGLRQPRPHLLLSPISESVTAQ